MVIFMKGAGIRGLLVSFLFAAAFCCILWISLSLDESAETTNETKTALVVSLDQSYSKADVAQSDEEAENKQGAEIVYYTFFEEKYHSCADCEQKYKAFEVLSATLEQAEKMGLKPCLSCQKINQK